jgi:hypothetical protein
MTVPPRPATADPPLTLQFLERTWHSKLQPTTRGGTSDAMLQCARRWQFDGTAAASRAVTHAPYLTFRSNNPVRFGRAEEPHAANGWSIRPSDLVRKSAESAQTNILRTAIQPKKSALRA